MQFDNSVRQQRLTAKLDNVVRWKLSFGFVEDHLCIIYVAEGGVGVGKGDVAAEVGGEGLDAFGGELKCGFCLPLSQKREGFTGKGG